MANGQQQAYDLSTAAHDPDFIKASAQDKIAFLSAHDSDFAKASPQDKAGYLNHILGYDQPTDIEKAGSQPNAFQRFSEVTLGTQHPIDELKAEGKGIVARPKEFAKSLGETLGIPRDFWAHPSDEYLNIGGSGIPGMVFGKNGLIKDPLGFGERFTGATQASEDVRNSNYGAIPGDILGGVANLALAKKPAEASGAALADTARNAKAGIADIVRTPENKLTPTTKVVSSLGAGVAGHYLGLPPAVGEFGGLFKGPAVADALLPRRPEPANFYGGHTNRPKFIPALRCHPQMIFMQIVAPI
jgi:hypothetical protein